MPSSITSYNTIFANAVLCMQPAAKLHKTSSMGSLHVTLAERYRQPTCACMPRANNVGGYCMRNARGTSCSHDTVS